MNQASSSQFLYLLDSAIVYRALLRKQWLNTETQEIASDAFYLRKKKNEVGISVNIASTCSPKQCAAKFINCYGIANLKVGQIRELGLDVISTSPTHANIVGLPYREDDSAKAERLADLLAQISQLVWLPDN
ncbi:hypothetical protein [Gloeocapsa sp. PCC 73106]|uniref:hypothetical protein n=1 Tax=Gloeocapsa sp. PCC 73106 TaxID=102232 RepID=UPI0002AC4836|nr:hypothetical protein [Gloeocapsa sp. PCC 73106]ELS00115.1 hypothetical protein GLO73106DRAFT_00039700 [Gloeocapsa sp. PCC 73106]